MPSSDQPSSKNATAGGIVAVEALPLGDWSGLSRRYLLYVPPADLQRPLPLVLSLHGAGERGDDINLVRVHGIPRRLAAGAGLPFVVVAPQCATDQRWDVGSLGRLLDLVERTEDVDPDRVYVTGLSMGGRATWSLAIAYPDRFAAIAPICGAGDPSAACRIACVPVWAFHGALDPVVPLERSVEMVEALRASGGDVRFTVYPDAEHDSWTRAYENDHLYEWLLSHRRRRPDA